MPRKFTNLSGKVPDLTGFYAGQGTPKKKHKRGANMEQDVPDFGSAFNRGAPPKKLAPRTEAEASITVVDMISHRCEATSQPVSVSPRYHQRIRSQEQPYVRQITVTTEWKPLDTGWIKEASLLILENDEGKRLTQVPTPLDKQKIDARVVEIGLLAEQQGFCLVAPGRHCHLAPLNLADLAIRCRSGEAKCTVYLFPA